MAEEYEEEYYDDEEAEDHNEGQEDDAECEYNEEVGDEDADIQVGEEIDLVRLFVSGVNSTTHIAKGHDALFYQATYDLFFPFPLQRRHTRKSGMIVL